MEMIGMRSRVGGGVVYAPFGGLVVVCVAWI